MVKGTHGKDEKSFEELDYVGQARTLNAQILVLSKGINAHLRRGVTEGKNIAEVKSKYKDQLMKIVQAL